MVAQQVGSSPARRGDQPLISENILAQKFNVSPEVMRRILIELKDHGKIKDWYDSRQHLRFAAEEELKEVKEGVDAWRFNHQAQVKKTVEKKETPMTQTPPAQLEFEPEPEYNKTWPKPDGTRYDVAGIARRLNNLSISSINSYATPSKGRLPQRKLKGERELVFFESDALEFERRLTGTPTAIARANTAAAGQSVANHALNAFVPPSTQRIVAQIIARPPISPTQAPAPRSQSPVSTPVPATPAPAPEQSVSTPKLSPGREKMRALEDYLFEQAGALDVEAFQEEEVEFEVRLPQDKLTGKRVMLPLDQIGANMWPNMTIWTVWMTTEDFPNVHEPFRVGRINGVFHHLRLATDLEEKKEEEEEKVD